MLSLECFSREVCQHLLMQGYSHFIIKYRMDRDELGSYCNVVTFEAIKGKTSKNAIPIKQIMDLPDETLTKYYVMYNEADHCRSPISITFS